jgi:Mg-chelatase subunit ChlD
LSEQASLLPNLRIRNLTGEREMRDNERFWARSSMLVLLLALHGGALGCETTEMATTAPGFITKIVAGSDKIKVYKTPAGKDEAYVMELLQPYFVICEEGEYYKITDVPADTVEEAMAGNVGYVPKLQSHLWPTREALAFSDVAFLEDRPEIVAWDDEVILKQFMETGNKKLHPPAFQENLEATRKRERSTRPYPVLSSTSYKFRNVADKRVYNVLLPAALPAEARIEIEKGDVQKTKDALQAATIVVVFDATGSMAAFASETANNIAAAVKSLDPDVVARSTMGFVFYRDVGDEEKLVAIPPLPVADAANALREAAGLMGGGGDAAEPLLDAVYFAAHLYEWGQHGRRILIGVLNDDAKLATEGTLDDKGRIPAGLDVNNIAKALFEEAIPIITVQAGSNFGPNLEAVMQPLADSTGGSFIRWDSGSTQKDIALALTKKMSAEAASSIADGKETLSKMEFDYRGYASIPLTVLDGEKLDRLRRNGVDFNINPGEGGVLVREGYIVENDDLLEPKIQIEKETLQGLINLYSVLGTTGVDSEAFLRSAGEAIAAIAGEEYDDTESISEIIRKNLGIQFRSELLNFKLEYLDTLNRAERLRYGKRIQDAGNTLARYLDANLAEFDSKPAVWMPVAALP